MAVNRGQPLSGSELQERLSELARELGNDGPDHHLVLVGGALLALHSLRESTLDVDTISRLDRELVDAVARVGRRRGLNEDWLNNRAQGFAPSTLRSTDCTKLFSAGRLSIWSPPLSQIFLMKLYRSDAQDLEDMVNLWPQCDFASANAVVDMFYAAYPHALPDEFLIEHVRRIRDASR